MTKAKPILIMAGTLDPAGTVYTSEALEQLADKFPGKLQYLDGQLTCLVELPSDLEHSRMKTAIAYQLDLIAQEPQRLLAEQARDARSDACTAREVQELPGGRGWRLSCWHPQWGGYGGHAEVEFSRHSGDHDGGPGCYELAVYHDGDFPSSEVEFTRHCCSADQQIRFGLDVLEAQMDHQLDMDDKPVQFSDHCRITLEGLRDRIEALLQR